MLRLAPIVALILLAAALNPRAALAVADGDGDDVVHAEVSTSGSLDATTTDTLSSRSGDEPVRDLMQGYEEAVFLSGDKPVEGSSFANGAAANKHSTYVLKPKANYMAAANVIALKELMPPGRLLVLGQGAVSFEFKSSFSDPRKLNQTSFRIVLRSNRKGVLQYSLVLQINTTHACFLQQQGTAVTELRCTDADGAALDVARQQRYWMSLDRKNLRLSYGKGWMMHQLELLSFGWLPQGQAPSQQNMTTFGWMRYIDTFLLSGVTRAVRPLIVVQADPIVATLPLLLASPQRITLGQLTGEYATVVANMAPELGTLYANVGGDSIELDREFAGYMQRSIDTPGCALHERLKNKSTEFGEPDPLATYLRITIGQDRGESPGVPFVVEIWPQGHYSPIHSHSDAFAVIKVLYGTIHTMFYSELAKEVTEPFQTANVTAGQVTWLAPQAYQTHKLWNTHATDMCVTIQLYQYPQDQYISHYDYFDYLGDGGKIEQYLPDSDWSWTALQQVIWQEAATNFNCA